MSWEPKPTLLARYASPTRRTRQVARAEAPVRAQLDAFASRIQARTHDDVELHIEECRICGIFLVTGEERVCACCSMPRLLDGAAGAS
jgi:hypothetical protein